MEDTQEKKLDRIQKFRPIDDAFFEVLSEEKGVCQEILRVIMQDDALTVHSVIPQSSIRNLYGRSVRLDTLCTLGNGAKVNIEIQKRDNDDHLRRARYNASMVAVKSSDAGEEYADMKDVYVVYITEKDFLKEGKTIYHIENVVMETGKVVENGLHQIFVNAAVDDGTTIAELMQCFLQSEVTNDKFPAIRDGIRRLKHTEGGIGKMCKIMEEVYAEGIEQGILKAKVEMLDRLTKDGGMTLQTACKFAGITPEEYETLKKSSKEM